MAPPGRRRQLSPICISLLLFFTFANIASAASAVLGIDLGTEYIKAALVKPGIPLEIVLTKDSKRKETAAVAFKPLRNPKPDSFPERIYGSDAIALAARFPGNVYPNLKPLLGMVEGSTGIAEYNKRFPALDVALDPGRKTVGFTSDAFGKESEPFLVEELLAMELQNIRANAEAMAGKGSYIRDVVITVPAFFTAAERRAVELAAELANLRVLSLISDGLAVGINYGTTRQFASASEGGKPEYHLVYDMGAGSTKATVLKFQGKAVKDVGRFNKTIQEIVVMGTGFDRELGGDILNGLIMDDIMSSFAASQRVKKLDLGDEAENTIRQNGRTAAKIWKESERLRQVLSANTQTQASFESLFQEIDFKYKITRADFEKMAEGFAARLAGPMERALAAAKLTIKDLDSIILHGGASRTPFVQKQVEAFAGDSGKIKSNVNADEAAVFGAAFQGAGISPSFRVKEIRTNETAVYAVTAQWSAETKDRQQKLFLPTSLTGAEKTMSVTKLDDFEMRLYQDTSLDGNGPDKIDPPTVRVNVKNLTASVAQLVDKFGCSKEGIDTKLVLRISPVDGIPEVVRGSVSCEVEKKDGVVDNVKEFFGFGSKKTDQQVLKEAASSDTTSATSSTSTAVKSSSSSAAPSASDKKSKEPKKRLEIVALDIVSTPAGIPTLGADALDRIKARLAAFDESDKSRRQREEALNTLEAFVYRARDILSDDNFVAASTEAERATLDTRVGEASDWLYGDGAEATREELRTRLKELKALVSPVETRQSEAVKRPEKLKLLEEALNNTKQLAGVIEAQMAKAAEEASSLSASLASAASESSASPVTSTTTSTEEDDFADLEDSTSSESSTTTTAPKAPITPEVPLYTEADIKGLNDVYARVSAWLSEKLSAQEKLGATDDPVLLSSELEAQQKEVERIAMEMISRQMRAPRPKAKSSKSKAKSKTKKGKGSKTTATGTATATVAKADATEGGGKAERAPQGAFEPSQEDILAEIEKLAEERLAAEKGRGQGHDEL